MKFCYEKCVIFFVFYIPHCILYFLPWNCFSSFRNCSHVLLPQTHHESLIYKDYGLIKLSKKTAWKRTNAHHTKSGLLPPDDNEQFE